MTRSYIQLVLFCVFGSSLLIVECQANPNCVYLDECPEAYAVAELYKAGKSTKKQNDALMNAFCFTVNGKYKVNCAAFRIYNHKNRNLLPELCGFISNGDRIIGGKSADPGEFPWMTLIYLKLRGHTELACAGSIISNRYILTAAHCVANREVHGIRIGEYNLETNDDCRTTIGGTICMKYWDIGVENITVHQDYVNEGSMKRRHDIALIRLPFTLDFTDCKSKKVVAAPICLPSSPNQVKLDLEGERAVVAGWGLMSNGAYSNVLMKVEVPINSPKMCHNYFMADHVEDRFRTSTSTFICAGVAGRDSCRRDSGGPLMIESIHGGYTRYVQYGIVSFGLDNCGHDRPGLYTDVVLHMDWILDNLKP